MAFEALTNLTLTPFPLCPHLQPQWPSGSAWKGPDHFLLRALALALPCAWIVLPQVFTDSFCRFI